MISAQDGRPTRRALLGAVFGIAAAFALPLPAGARPLRKIKDTGLLRVAVYRDFAPWSWREDGVLKGIDVEFGEALAARLGVKAELIDFMADEDVGDDLRNMVWRGPLIGGTAADVMMHVPYDPAFAKANDRVVIVGPYYREGFAMACARDIDCEVPPPQFKGKKLAAELDSIPDFYLSGSFGGVLRADVTHQSSALKAFDLVTARQADVVMATRAQVEHALTRPDAGGLVMRKGALPALPSAGWDVGLAIKDDSRDLADVIEGHVEAMRADGSIDAILKRFGVSPHAPLHG
jgi:ABC-type amino acid transport substrate-binding protein